MSGGEAGGPVRRGPLANVRVLDLSRLVPGPFCTLLLADLGADVIKIEEPGRGDYMREYGPRVNATAVGYAYALLNRNKRSISLDLKSARGRSVLKRLVRSSDVLVESFRPGVMARLGLAFEDLAGERADLVYCSISGFGGDDAAGPPAHDINLLAIAGHLYRSGREPNVPLVPLTDFETGQRAALAICAALLDRRASGRGRHLDIAMLDGAVTWMTLALADLLGTGADPLSPDELQDRGMPRMIGRIPGYGVYETSDHRHIALGVVEKMFWRSLCDAIGRPDLAGVDLAPNEVEEQLRAALRGRPLDEWLRRLSGAGIPVAPVNTVRESATAPAIAERHLLPTVEDPALGRYTVVRTALGCDEPPVYRCAPPELGQHTDQVLAEAGIAKSELDDLRRDRVIA